MRTLIRAWAIPNAIIRIEKEDYNYNVTICEYDEETKTFDPAAHQIVGSTIYPKKAFQLACEVTQSYEAISSTDFIHNFV